MNNADATAMDVHSEEATLDTEKISQEDTVDAVNKVGEETQKPELLDDWTEDDSMDEIEEGISKITFTSTEGDTDPSDKTVRRVHGERSEVATGQHKTVYMMVTGHNLATGQRL